MCGYRVYSFSSLLYYYVAVCILLVLCINEEQTNTEIFAAVPVALQRKTICMRSRWTSKQIKNFKIKTYKKYLVYYFSKTSKLLLELKFTRKA